VSFSYVLIFVILETKIWALLMLIFLAEMVWTVLVLAGVESVEKTAAIWRLIIFAATDSTLLLFWLLQKWIITIKFRGMYFSVHLVIVKTIFDLIASYFIWSHYQRLLYRPKLNQVMPAP
jgi:hypothetical protein